MFGQGGETQLNAGRDHSSDEFVIPVDDGKGSGCAEIPDRGRAFVEGCRRGHIHDSVRAQCGFVIAAGEQQDDAQVGLGVLGAGLAEGGLGGAELFDLVRHAQGSPFHQDQRGNAYDF